MKKLFSLLSALILFCVNVTPVMAYSGSTSVTNNGKIGAVDIELHQYFPQEQTAVLPGQIVSIKSTVENKYQPAWIRVKLEYPSSTEEGLKDLDDSLITFADGAWEKIGSYYYLKEAVDSKETVPFTEAIQFPHDWDSTMANVTKGMVFTAEAIQEKNFLPDFTSQEPWHGAVIEAFDGNDYTMKEEGNERFSIIYKNGAKGLVHVGEDFFSNWGDIMPGDELEDAAKIENRMNIPVEMYFSMKASGDAELLKKIRISITNGSETVYDGPLSESVSRMLLKEYQSGEKTDFRYHLSVPAEFDNAHALAEFEVVWTFDAEEIPPEEPDTIVKIIEIIKTGEYSTLIGIAGLGIAAGAAGLLYYRKRRAGG